jgi:hypothetical protein
MPWWHTGAAGGAAWPWLGAALAKTDRIVVGTGVTAPILRYNPAVVAPVSATLGYMFPGRIFLGLGRGDKKLDKYVGLGFTEIVLINSSPNREIFIKLLSQEIAPAFRDANKPPAKAETTT